LISEDNFLDQIYDRIYEYERYGKEMPTYRVLQISDWHMDFEYMEGTVKRDCGFERCCHAKCGFPVDKLNDGAKKFGEITGCDLPLTTCQE